MRRRTRQNVITIVVGTTPSEILGPSPRRKSFMLSPVSAGPVPGTIVGVVLTPASGATWTVPAGVTQLLDVYCWGSGGDSGQANGTTLGGGGGGASAFCSSGPVSVVPGSVLPLQVGGAGPGAAVTTSFLKTPANVNIVLSFSAGGGTNDIGGAGNQGGVGLIVQNGGNGATATALGGNGGGGGGSGGIGGAGGNGNGVTGGAAGAGGGFNGLGVGQAGATASAAAGIAVAASSPGAGGAGGGATHTAKGAGAAGQVIVFYYAPGAAGAISLSPRQDVVAGQGALNFLPGESYPTVVTDHDIGAVIADPWWIVSAVAGVVVQVIEFLYEDECDE